MCLSKSWLVIIYGWLAVRFKRPMDNFEVKFWTAVSPVCFFLYAMAISMAFAGTYSGDWAGYLYFAVVAAIALAIGLIIFVTAGLTLRDLSKFKHHAMRMKRLSVNVIVCGVILVVSIALLALTASSGFLNT